MDILATISLVGIGVGVALLMLGATTALRRALLGGVSARGTRLILLGLAICLLWSSSLIPAVALDEIGPAALAFATPLALTGTGLLWISLRRSNRH